MQRSQAVAKPSDKRSPLAVTVLALLFEAPMHPYRMHELIKERRKDSVVNVAQRNSVYQTIERLQRNGWISVAETQQVSGRPERVVYEITSKGRATLEEWMKEMLASPAQEYPEFPVALSYLPILGAKEVQARLEMRKQAVAAAIKEAQDSAKAATAMGLPRLFLLEEEYKITLLKAELKWVEETIAALKSGELAWDMTKLLESFGKQT